MIESFGGRTFELLRVSDVKRDGVGLEAYEDRNLVAEVFYSDNSQDASFSTFEAELPIELVTYMATEGLRLISPVESKTNNSHNNSDRHS